MFSKIDNWLFRHLGYRYLLIRSPLATQQRVRWVAKQIGGNSLKILDVGCGNGVFSFCLAQNGHHITAIDYGPLVIKCQARYRLICKKIQGKIRFIAYDLRKFDELKLFEIFDYVICAEVLEHIKNDEKLIRDISWSLRKGGKLVLTAPNKYYQSLLGDYVSEVENGSHVRWGYDIRTLKYICHCYALEIKKVEYLGGYFIQKCINFERRFALLGTAITMVAAQPLRWLSVLDPFIRWEPLSIAVVAEKVR